MMNSLRLAIGVSWPRLLRAIKTTRTSNLAHTSTESANISAHMTEGNQLLQSGKVEEAMQCYTKATAIDTHHADAHLNLGFTLVELGRFVDSITPLQRTIQLNPTSWDAHYLLGTSYSTLGNPRQSIHHFETAISLKRDLVVAYCGLGKILCEVGHNSRAKTVLLEGIKIDPTSADLHYFLGNVQAAEMEFDDALISYRQALHIRPAYAQVYANMAVAMLNRCDYDDAIVAARQALALDPQMHPARSNLLVALSRSTNCTAEGYLSEAKAFGKAIELGGSSFPVISKELDRPLRIGFVSGDLRMHPVGFFLVNVMANWDSDGIHAFAYSNHKSQDELTERLRPYFVAWRDISGVSDAEAARQICSDGIDLLIDLSGHTADNRLPLFALRPASVQATWLGYWASTGMSTIDYVICDHVSVPIEACEQFTERPWYLPETRMCFAPPAEDAAPDVAAPPALVNGYVTFGSFQNLTKLNQSVLRLWARVMQTVPASRLRIQSQQLKNRAMREQLSRRLTEAGIDEARTRLVEPGTRLEYLAAHADVDMLLDTFPHGGGTTTCEALWMGVPTLTLAGSTMLSRQGASLLTCAGLAEWVARDEDEYVILAKRLAADLGALAFLRRTLRPRILASPLFDAARFSRNLQDALRAMWHEKASRHLAGAKYSDASRFVNPHSDRQ